MKRSAHPGVAVHGIVRSERKKAAVRQRGEAVDWPPTVPGWSKKSASRSYQLLRFSALELVSLGDCLVCVCVLSCCPTSIIFNLDGEQEEVFGKSPLW